MTASIHPFPKKAPGLPKVKVQTCNCGNERFYLEASGAVLCSECLHIIKNLNVIDLKDSNETP